MNYISDFQGNARLRSIKDSGEMSQFRDQPLLGDEAHNI